MALHEDHIEGDLVIRVRSALARGLVGCLLLSSVIGTTQNGHAASATKNYTSSKLHFALSYPSNWTLVANLDTASFMGKLEAKVSPTALGIISPDKTAAFAALVKTGASTGAQIKSNVTAFLKEDNVLVSPIAYQNITTTEGMKLLMATVTDKGDGKHLFQATMVAGSKGPFTWYIGGSYQEKYPNTQQDKAAVNAILASFRNT